MMRFGLAVMLWFTTVDAVLAAEIVQANDRQSIPAGATHGLIARCPDGKTVTGGGFSIDSNDAQFRVRNNSPVDTQQWRVTIRNTATIPYDSNLTVFALCM
jgi:hypothetical protein